MSPREPTKTRASKLQTANDATVIDPKVNQEWYQVQSLSIERSPLTRPSSSAAVNNATDNQAIDTNEFASNKTIIGAAEPTTQNTQVAEEVHQDHRK